MSIGSNPSNSALAGVDGDTSKSRLVSWQILLSPLPSLYSCCSGTHGHMKCQFDGILKSQDTIFMNLYKRIFPKWTYEPLTDPEQREKRETMQ